MGNKLEFSTFDTVRLLGIKRETLKDWLNEGYIKPVRTTRDSRGAKSFFDVWELYYICVFKEIISRGISRQNAAKMVDSLRSLKSDSSGFFVAAIEYVVFFMTENGAVKAEFITGRDKISPVDITTGTPYASIYLFNFRSIRNQLLLKIED